MKKIICFAVITILLLGACKKESLPTAQSSRFNTAISQNGSSNAAVIYKNHYQIDLTTPGWYEINSCTGEHLQIISGVFHIDYNELSNKNIQTIHGNYSTSNYKLISVETGIEYTGSYVNTFNLAFMIKDQYYTGMVVYSETLSILLTTAGVGNNSMLKMDAHVTIDTDGNFKSWVDNFRAGCQ